MAPVAGASQFDYAALARRQALAGSSGPAALVKNIRVFGIACFACLGGLLYGVRNNEPGFVIEDSTTNRGLLVQSRRLLWCPHNDELQQP